MLNDSAIKEVVEADIAKHKQDNSTGNNTQVQEGKKEGDGEGAGAAAAIIDDKSAGEGTKVDEKPDPVAELLKKLNLTSVDELEEKLSSSDKKKLTKEEQDKADELYEANLQKFAVDKGIMKLDDFHQFKTLKQKQAAELVYENHLKDFKEENKEDIKDLKEEEIAALAKEDFEKEYKLNSENKAAKEKGLKRVQKEADEMVNPLKSSYEDAKILYDAEEELRAIYPKFAKSNEKIVADLVPEKVEWFKTKDGEEEIPVEVDLSPEDRKEIQDKVIKKLQVPEALVLFKDGKVNELKEMVSDYAELLVGKKARELGNAKIAEVFEKRGTAKGSTTGATNSFAVNQTKPGAHAATTKTKADVDKEVLDQFGRK